jgi:hypothetical protein
MITTKLPLDSAIAHISKGVGMALEEKIKAALMPHAEKVVDEVAKDLCKNLKANLSSYTEYSDFSVRIALVIDGDRHEF